MFLTLKGVSHKLCKLVIGGLKSGLQPSNYFTNFTVEQYEERRLTSERPV